LNEDIKAYAAAHPGLEYIDTEDMIAGPDGKPRPELLRADQLHLSPAGYKLLVERVRPYLK
jgi:lysophospholipase L1-like esterase